MKTLCMILTLVALSSPAWSSNRNAPRDRNQVPASLGVNSLGETRPILTDDDGAVVLTPNTTIYVNVAQTVAQGSAGAAQWPVKAAQTGSFTVTPGTGTWPVQDVSTVGKSYVYVSSAVTAVPATFTLTGKGSSWFVQSKGGGDAAFYFEGSTVTVFSGQKVSGDFKFSVTNPKLYLTTLPSGATVQIFMDGTN